MPPVKMFKLTAPEDWISPAKKSAEILRFPEKLVLSPARTEILDNNAMKANSILRSVLDILNAREATVVSRSEKI